MNRDDNRFDYLRLLAAWLVLFSHCYPLGGRPANEPLASTLGIDTLGGVGVSIFFVLSGYLVAQSIERSRDLRDFARRRALRIFPALIVVCLLCVLALGPMVTTLPLAQYFTDPGTWSYLRTATGWSIKYQLPGVFADNPAGNAVNGSLWSLPDEIRCYLVLALASLVPVALRFKALAALLALAVLLALRPEAQSAKFAGLGYFLNKLGFLFALGACWAAWAHRFTPRSWMGPPLVLGALLLLPRGMPQLLLFELGLGITVLWLALYGRWLPRIPSRWGDWSYGLYLYAFPVQQALAHARLHEVSFVSYVLASTLVTVVFAGLSWHLVEKPALRWKTAALPQATSASAA